MKQFSLIEGDVNFQTSLLITLISNQICQSNKLSEKGWVSSRWQISCVWIIWITIKLTQRTNQNYGLMQKTHQFLSNCTYIIQEWRTIQYRSSKMKNHHYSQIIADFQVSEPLLHSSVTCQEALILSMKAREALQVPHLLKISFVQKCLKQGKLTFWFSERAELVRNLLCKLAAR